MTSGVRHIGFAEACRADSQQSRRERMPASGVRLGTIRGIRLRRNKRVACNTMLRFLAICFLLIAASAATSQGLAPPGVARRHTPASCFKEATRLLEAGSLDQALSLTNEGLKQAPQSVEGLNLLGVICNQQGKYDEAVVHLKQALAIAPNSADTLVNLALSYANQNKVELSVQTLKKALRIQPGNRTAEEKGAIKVQFDAVRPTGFSAITRVWMP